MTITTVDEIIAGMRTSQFFLKALTGTMVAGRPISTWGLAGIPGAGSYDTTLNGVTLSSSSALVAGQIPFYDAAGGDETRLTRFFGALTIGGRLLLCDRIWHNGGFTITSTGAQSITSPTWPARDDDGATAGKGVVLGIEVSATTGAGTPTLTVGYTNSAASSGRSATNIIATVATSVLRTFYPIGLQAGDLGVKSVENFTLSATWTSGTINLVAFRVLAELDIAGALAGASADLLTMGFPRLYDGTVPFLLFYPSATTTSHVSGSVSYAQG